MEDSALKSLIVGRLGSAITGVVAILALFGVDISSEDVENIRNLGDLVTNNSFAMVSVISMVISTAQALFSKYKKR